jgi:hypothetical protein
MTVRIRISRRLTAAPLVLLAAFLCSSYTLSTSCAVAQATAAPDRSAAIAEFPAELVKWKLRPGNPVFAGEGPGHWDVKIRERGWIMRDGDVYRLWYTGYDGTQEGIKRLGYATSPDGLKWTRSAKNPLIADRWVEDMTVVVHDGIYYMFAEGKDDNHTELLTSKDGIDWKREGPLDVRAADGGTQAKRPCGTPTVWIENGIWYLFYEWNDKGVWLAKTTYPLRQMWVNVQDEPVLTTGPGEYDKDMIAVDQVIRYGGAYYAFYHGSGKKEPRTWNTNIARSVDLVHWKKYPGNPIVDDNKSSGMVIPVAAGFRLYTMHDQVDVFESREK